MRVEEAINKGDMNPNDNIDIPIIETGTKGNKHQNPHAYVCPGTDYPVRKIWRTTITQAMNAAGAISYNQAAEKLFTLVKLSLGDGGFIMGPDGSGVSNAKSCLPKKIAQEMKGLSPRQMGEIAQKYGIPTTTAYDMASLMAHIERNSDQYPLTRQALSTPSVIINGKEYKTTNRFVRNGQDISAKTGTTDLSGFNLAAVASGGKNAVCRHGLPGWSNTVRRRRMVFKEGLYIHHETRANRIPCTARHATLKTALRAYGF
jgi:hypothetical protein